MSTHAARKLRTVIANAQAVLAIEMLVAAQAVEWRVATLRGVPPTPRTLAEADEQARLFEEVTAARSEVAAHLGNGTRAAYLRVRDAAQPVLRDRPLDGDIRAVRGLLG